MTAGKPDPTLAHRCGNVSVTVLNGDGQPQSDREVIVEQGAHAFRFGNIGFDFISLANQETDPQRTPFGGASPEQAARLTDLWFDVFNTATLPFYWGAFEPHRGHPDTARLHQAAQWFVDHGCQVKGHPLVWHTLTADWLRDLPTDEVEAAVRARIRRDVADFAGVVDTWDAINEVVIMPVFHNEQHRNGITRLAWERGRIATVRLAFDEARKTNPAATLLLNDFDMSTAYECLIEGVLEAGIQVDATRPAEPHAPGLLGRGEDPGDPRPVRPLRPADPHDRDHAGVRRPDAAGDRGPQRLPGPVLALHAGGRGAAGRRDRPPLPHAAVAPLRAGRHLLGSAGRRRLARRALRLVRADGTPKPAYDALRTSSRASGGSRRRRCAPTTPAESMCAGSSATINCTAPVALHPSHWPRRRSQRLQSGSSGSLPGGPVASRPVAETTALVAGFGGLRQHDGLLSFAPQLPEPITRLRFTIRWRGLWLGVDIEPDRATYTLRNGLTPRCRSATTTRHVTVTTGEPLTEGSASDLRCCLDRRNRLAGTHPPDRTAELAA